MPSFKRFDVTTDSPTDNELFLPLVVLGGGVITGLVIFLICLLKGRCCKQSADPRAEPLMDLAADGGRLNRSGLYSTPPKNHARDDESLQQSCQRTKNNKGRLPSIDEESGESDTDSDDTGITIVARDLNTEFSRHEEKSEEGAAISNINPGGC